MIASGTTTMKEAGVDEAKTIACVAQAKQSAQSFAPSLQIAKESMRDEKADSAHEGRQ